MTQSHRMSFYNLGELIILSQQTFLQTLLFGLWHGNNNYKLLFAFCSEFAL